MVVGKWTGAVVAVVLVTGLAGCRTTEPDATAREHSHAARPERQHQPADPGRTSAAPGAQTGGGGRSTARPGEKVTWTTPQALASLPVRREHRARYDRDRFTLWVDVDGNGCDTRDEVLITENRSPDASLSGCTVVDGSWYSYYDDVTTTQASDFDIDHLVPLAEAWDSGAWAWSPPRRQAYANDLGEDRTLIAVTASSNRTKSDADPTGWLPAHQQCVYVNSWIAVKLRWALAVDPAELRTLRTLAGRCGFERVTFRRAQVTAAGGGSTADARPSRAGTMPAAAPPAGDHRHGHRGSDPRFGTCTEAVAAGYGPYRRGQREYAWYDDADGDGVVCE